MTDATENRDFSYELAKGEVEGPKYKGAGVLLPTPYLSAEPTWEYYSNVAWNPWAVDEIEGESRGKVASGHGEDEDAANKATTKAQERRIVKFPNEGTTHSQIPEQGGDAKSNPGEEDDAKSNPHTPIHA